MFKMFRDIIKVLKQEVVLGKRVKKEYTKGDLLKYLKLQGVKYLGIVIYTKGDLLKYLKLQGIIVRRLNVRNIKNMIKNMTFYDNIFIPSYKILFRPAYNLADRIQKDEKGGRKYILGLVVILLYLYLYFGYTMDLYVASRLMLVIIIYLSLIG